MVPCEAHLGSVRFPPGELTQDEGCEALWSRSEREQADVSRSPRFPMSFQNSLFGQMRISHGPGSTHSLTEQDEHQPGGRGF